MLRLYQFGPRRIPECNQCNRKVIGNGYAAMDSFEAVDKRYEAVNGCEAEIGIKAED